jgi:neutral ceramidase
MKETVFTSCFKVSLKLCILFFLFSSSIITIAGDLKIGAASVKITPPVGIPMAGYYYDRGATGIHDDLFAKALVIEKDGLRIAIVSCDIIGVTTEIVTQARSLAVKSTGIDSDHIMISATHSHTGPVIPKKIDRYNITGKSAEMLAEYISKLPGLIAESIKLANNALVPAIISFGRGHEESISFNRRFYMTDGTVGWNPGRLNPKIIKPAGPIDPDVLVLYAETLDNKPISTYVNFALHLDQMGGTEISADMPFPLSTVLGKIKGPEMVTLFGQGCSGNINHINVNSKTYLSGYAMPLQNGTILAGEVIKAYTRMVPFEISNISVKREVVKLAPAEFSPDDVPKARETIATQGKPNAAPFIQIVNAHKIVELNEKKGALVEAEIQVFALGNNFAVVSLPGEVFTELGMYIKARSPFPNTIIVELTNGSIGYIPDRKAFIEGNYEPVSSRCAPGCGEILVEKALSLLNELKKQ